MKKLRLTLALLLLLGTVATVQAVTGIHGVYSWLLPGAPNTGKTCAELDDVYADPGTTWVEYKFNANPSDGAGGCQAGGGDGTIAVTFSNCTSGGFDWSSTIGVDAVVVKDGVDGANFYVYDGLTSPADGTVGPSGGSTRDSEETSDTNLTTPNDGAKGTSHVSFCYDVEEPGFGSLKVTKTVDWSGIEPDTSKSFEICISGPSYPTGTEVGACQTVGYEGGELTWDNLIPGDYTVTETNPGSAWTVEITGSPATVIEDQTAEASVKNTHCTNGLKVTKTVDWGKSDPDANQTFEICISGPSYPTGEEDGACQTVGYEGGELTWDNLIPGDYTVTETDPGSTWTVEITGSPATVNCGTAEASVKNIYEKPTAITLPSASFSAEVGAGSVILAWETATEMDNAGFNLYRALLRDGPYTQINETLITSEGDAASGASYSFVDATDYGTYYYKLEDVDLYGMTTLHGPVRVTVARPLRRPLYRPSLPEF